MAFLSAVVPEGHEADGKRWCSGSAGVLDWAAWVLLGVVHCLTGSASGISLCHACFGHTPKHAVDSWDIVTVVH